MFRILPAGRRRVAPLAALLALALLTLAPACLRDEPASARRATVIVTRRVVPKGAQVQALADAGIIGSDVVPGDLASDDAVTDLAEVRCLVVGIDLPQGTVLRRRHLTEPARIGLDHGIAPDGSAVTCG